MLPLNKVDSGRCVKSPRWAALSRSRRFVQREAMAKYFVTGATGFIGGRVTPQLVGAGHEGGAIARKPGSAEEPVSPGGDFRPGGITGPDFPPPPMGRGRWGVPISGRV